MLAAALLSSATLVTLLTSSCGAASRIGSMDTKPMASLVIDSHPQDVSIYIDGAYLGSTAQLPDGTLPVPSDATRLELRSEGYHPHRRDLTLQPDRSYTLHVRLVRDLR